MNLFRSEEHVTRWLAGREPGATIPVTKLSELAHAWWGAFFPLCGPLPAGKRAPAPPRPPVSGFLSLRFRSEGLG